MARQQHKIMRQVLEIGGCLEADAARIQSEVRATYFRSLLPSIETSCSQLSTAAQVHRVSRLEIDLGEVPVDGLEAVLAERFEPAFTSGLAAAIESAGPATADADLEQYSCFVRTGTVPWWADRADPHLLDASLDALLRRAPGAVRQAIESAPARDTVCRRLARAHPDRLLDDLAGMLASGLAAARPGLGVDWIAVLEIVASAHAWPRPVARTLWWEELLRAAIDEDLLRAFPTGDALASNAPPVFGAILSRLAARLGIEYHSLVADLRRAIAHTDTTVQPWVRAVVESLGHDADVRVAANDATATAQLARLPAAERSLAMARLRRAADGAPFQNAGGPTASGARVDPVRERDARTDPDFSDADEIYVENAGLVMLWPFLEHFFAHLDLVEAKQFRSVEARQRAIGLLQYLATEEAAAPEFLVPLNKVLCGMPLDDVFDFGPSIEGAEMDACTDLLTAAIHHAPVLRDMSLRGFRGSFLLRRGQLSARDGGWLLRVERHTHDIVLDRFPWSARIVKLPWMAAILHVEW